MLGAALPGVIDSLGDQGSQLAVPQLATMVRRYQDVGSIQLQLESAQPMRSHGLCSR